MFRCLLLSLVLLSGCTYPPRQYINLETGKGPTCKVRVIYPCGVVLRECDDGFEYDCLVDMASILPKDLEAKINK